MRSCPLEALGSRGLGQEMSVEMQEMQEGPGLQQQGYMRGSYIQRLGWGRLGRAGEQPGWALQTVLEIHTRQLAKWAC